MPGSGYRRTSTRFPFWDLYAVHVDGTVADGGILASYGLKALRYRSGLDQATPVSSPVQKHWDGCSQEAFQSSLFPSRPSSSYTCGWSHLWTTTNRRCQCYLCQPCDISGVEIWLERRTDAGSLLLTAFVRGTGTPAAPQNAPELHHRPIPVLAISPHPPPASYTMTHTFLMHFSHHPRNSKAL